jgi:hypothetical protein
VRFGLLGIGVLACTTPHSSPVANSSTEPAAQPSVVCYFGTEVNGTSKSPVSMRRTVDPRAYRIIDEEALPGVIRVATWIVDRDARTMRQVPDPHAKATRVVGELEGPAWRWTAWTTHTRYGGDFEVRARTIATPTSLETRAGIARDDGSLIDRSTRRVTVGSCKSYESSRDGMQIY